MPQSTSAHRLKPLEAHVLLVQEVLHQWLAGKQERRWYDHDREVALTRGRQRNTHSAVHGGESRVLLVPVVGVERGNNRAKGAVRSIETEGAGSVLPLVAPRSQHGLLGTVRRVVVPIIAGQQQRG